MAAMSRLRDAFGRGRPALVVYLTFGDPDPDTSVDVVAAAVAAGADVIELGVPFSDPSADGPVIQAAMERALAAGGSLPGAIAAVRTLRGRGVTAPIVLFGYYNPPFVYGVDRFAADVADAGVDAVLTVDLPIEELGELRGPLAAYGVDVVPLVAPTSTDDRIARIRPIAPPFVYYVSLTGVTGAALAGARLDGDRIARIRAAAGAPVAVGFGIKTAADVRAVAAIADGVVVGSAVVARVADGAPDGAPARVGELVAALRAALGGRDPG
jgi:tryptophan synthase alpha chain